MLRRKFLAASFGTMASAMAPASIQRNGQLFTGAALAFGTTVSVSVVHDDERQAAAAIRDALDQATHIDRLMSIYNPASQVFQLNRDGVLEKPHPDMLLVLRQAHALSELTRGAFDITVQPLWQAYRAAADQAALPTPQQRRHAKLRVGWRRLAFSAERVTLGKLGAAITLNGLAQGYAADLAMAAVRARGIEHALLDTGEFSAHGNNGARHPWTLGVLHPRDADALDRADLGPGTTLVVTSTDSLGSSTLDRLRVHAGGARVVLVDPGPGVTSAAGIDTTPSRTRLGDGRDAACTDPTYDGLRLEVDDALSFPAEGCFGAEGEAVLVERDGLVLFGGGDALTNDQVLRADNAAIALRLLGQDERLVWYVPSLDDLVADDGVSVSSLLPDWIRPGIWLAGLAVVFVTVRLTRPDPERGAPGR